MNGETLALQFGFNGYVLGVNTVEVTHEQSLWRPEPAGNCLNWIAGHMLVTRFIMLYPKLNLEPSWDLERVAIYVRGSDPLTEPESATPFERILADFQESQEQVLPALAGLAEDRWDEAVPEKPFGRDETLRTLIAGLSFHESYHAGQTGILRRLLGHPGAIT